MLLNPSAHVATLFLRHTLHVPPGWPDWKPATSSDSIAAPRAPINAVLDVLASLRIDQIDMSATPISCGARSPARGRSNLRERVAVGVGNYLHQVTVGVVEIDAATTVQIIGLAGSGAPRIGVIPDDLSAVRINAASNTASLTSVIPRPDCSDRAAAWTIPHGAERYARGRLPSSLSWLPSCK
jgi:hypothetical protein